MLGYNYMHILLTWDGTILRYVFHVVQTSIFRPLAFGSKMREFSLPRQKGKPVQVGNHVKFKGIDFVVASRCE